jgi:hypothetical protein
MLRFELGEQQYLFHDESGEAAPTLVISSHGHYWYHFTRYCEVPRWAELSFLVPHGQALDNPGVAGAACSDPIETVPGGKMVRNYVLSKFQGRHGSRAEDYDVIKKIVEKNRRDNPGWDKTGHFDVLTIRHRRGRTDPSLGSVLEMLDYTGFHYGKIVCSFCRCTPALPFSGGNDAMPDIQISGPH